LVEYKGIRELLSAIDTASRIEQNLELLIVGDGPLRFEVEEFCRSHPRGAKFAGPVDQETLHRLYAVADVHVMPSYSEAFGVVCPEALAFGVPSIVTRTSGCADLIVDGENGLLVEPRDASSLSDAILMLASNHAMLENMRTNAPKAVANLTLKQVQGQMKRIVLEAANQIES